MKITLNRCAALCVVGAIVALCVAFVNVEKAGAEGAYVHVGDCQGSLTGYPGDRDILNRMGQIKGYKWAWDTTRRSPSGTYGYQRFSGTRLEVYVTIWNRNGLDWEPSVEQTFYCYRAGFGSIFDNYGSFADF